MVFPELPAMEAAKVNVCREGAKGHHAADGSGTDPRGTLRQSGYGYAEVSGKAADGMKRHTRGGKNRLRKRDRNDMYAIDEVV